MHYVNKAVAAAVATMVAGTLVSVPASAQFYKGKTLNVIINYGAGGNTDIQGRSLLRFMTNYIPGNPRMIIKNMPGAGGVVGTNYLGEAAKRDGSVMGVFTVAIMPEVMGDKALRVKHGDFAMIGGIGQQQIAHVLKSTAKDVKEFIALTKPFKSAGHAPNSSKDISIKLTLSMLGLKHSHVTGFKSAGDIRRAMLQNDIQYTEDSVTGYYAAVVPTLVKPGLDIPLWHTGVNVKGGGMVRAESMDKNIPAFIEVYEMKHGKGARPKGVVWDAYRVIAGSRQFLRIIVLPPGAPKQAVDDLRAAWKKTTQDKDYLAEYRKQNNSELEALVGEDAAAAIADVLDVKPEVRKFIVDFAAKN